MIDPQLQMSQKGDTKFNLKINKMETTKTKPSLIEQWEAMKEKHPDAIIIFRVGDFYETFGNDAIKASEILGITLTKRLKDKTGKTTMDSIELAGFPHFALDTYLPKLVRGGNRVAICEELEKPKPIAKRGIATNK